MRVLLSVFVSFAFLVSSVTASSQAGLSPTSLKVDGLNFESEVTALYLGDFGNARMERDGSAYSFLLSEFINAYSRICPSHLPRNKVELTKTRCIAETVTRNGFGVETNRYCSQYETYGTGRYADPALLRISSNLDAKLSREVLGDIIPRQGSDPAAASRRMTDVALSAKGDMDRLLAQNSCGSAALKRFQANLERFGSQQAPLRLANSATLATVRGGGGAYVKSDYSKLVDALVRVNAQGWMMNRYIGGSISQVSVRTGADGRPIRINARYRFNTLGQVSNGAVDVSFENGRPKCLFFFDAPQTCRVPSPGVVTAYEKGEYR